MNTWQIIKHFEYGQLWKLFLLSIKYPVYVIPTLRATSKSFLNAKKEFPELHGKKGKANAYRHAYWNALICFYCYKWKKDGRRIVAWSRLITSKHEELSPNEPIDTAMDLHNNKIGINLFISGNFKTEDEISERIKYKLQSAKKIVTPKDVELHPLELVYIEEDER